MATIHKFPDRNDQWMTSFEDELKSMLSQTLSEDIIAELVESARSVLDRHYCGASLSFQAPPFDIPEGVQPSIMNDVITGMQAEIRLQIAPQVDSMLRGLCIELIKAYHSAILSGASINATY